MLYLLMCLLPSSASDWREYYDLALVQQVDSALAECSIAYGIFEDFMSNIRRRDENNFAEVEGIMKTCGSILEAADIFRNDPQAYEFGLSSGLIYLEPEELNFLKSKLLTVSKEIGDVLYIASRDGDDASSFHSACDNKGPTIVIVQTTSGAVFGGYAGESWGGSSRSIRSSDSFMFSFFPMVHFAIADEYQDDALYNNPSAGPIFGQCNDLLIRSNALSVDYNHLCGRSYVSSDGKYITDIISLTSSYFEISEYVVLEAI